MKETVQIAVRSLVAHVLSRGDLGTGFRGASRNVDAIRAHQKIQKSRPAGYVPEVSVTHEWDAGDLVIVISGRIDGVFGPRAGEKERRVCIEEIKTTTGDLTRWETAPNPLHWGQAKVYAYIYARHHELADIDVQLTYYHLDSGKQLTLPRPFTFVELEVFFTDLMGRYLAWARTLAAWRHLRDESIEGLAFPYPAYRPGQRPMAVNVYNAIRQRRQLLVQAPTGIGKTMAALFPAIKCLPSAAAAKIFYLTARTTARSVAEKALAALRDGGLRLKSLTLTAKDKICFEPESACTGEECPYARGFYDRIRPALESLFAGRDTFDRDTVERTARSHDLCPFELSLELSQWADVIICDYNYAFDPRVHLRRFFVEAPDRYVFLVDEAHNLVDRAREMFSSQLEKKPFLALRRAVKGSLPGMHKTLGRISRYLAACRKRCEAAGGTLSEPAAPEDLAPLLRDFLVKAEDRLNREEPAAFGEALLELYFSVSGFVKILDQFDERYVTCLERNGTDLRLKLFCMDPAARLKNALTRCSSAVFFSATLTPADYFHHLLGCSDTTGRLELPSPFPAENLCLLTAGRISTRYRHRPRSLQAVAGAIRAAVTRKTGNYLLFFPSYEYLRQVHDALGPQLPEAVCLVQVASMDEAEREAFLARFRLPGERTLLGFVVMGGIFGEGIDLVGERLSGAVIVGVGLPGISLENELIRNHFDETCRRGFAYAYVYPGINRVLQAAGRVIRTESDRGVVLLVDDRFETRQYRELLPPHWRPGRGENPRRIESVVDRFWQESAVSNPDPVQEAPYRVTASPTSQMQDSATASR